MTSGENDSLAPIFWLLPASAAAAWLGGFFVYRVLASCRVMDVSNARSSHDGRIVRGGGLAILLVLGLAWLWAASAPLSLPLPDPRLAVAVILVAAISFADDLRPLPFWARLPVHGIAAVIALGGPGGAAAGASLFVLILAWIWIVGYANAFNFMDGINGLAVSQIILASLFGAGFCLLGAGTEGARTWLVPQILLAGAALGFLPHNFPKARMFLGDVGSVTAGFLLALILVGVWKTAGWRAGCALGAMHLNFLLDTSITMGRRLRRGERVHEPHREHFYQRLLRSGQSHQAVTLREAGLQILFGTTLLLTFQLPVGVFAIVLVAVLTGWLLFFRACELRFRNPGCLSFMAPRERMNALTEELRDNVLLRRVLSWGWHVVGVFLCWWLAFLIRFDFAPEASYVGAFHRTVWIAAVVFVGCIAAFRLYEGLWRFFSFRDCLQAAAAFLVGTLVLGILIFARQGFDFSGFPRSVLIINYLLILAWEIGGRGLLRLFREWRIVRINGQRRPGGGTGSDAAAGAALLEENLIVLVGEPEECDGLVRSLNRQAGQLGRIAAIVTAGHRHEGGRLHGIRLHSGIESVGQVVHDMRAKTVLILPPFTAPGRVREIVESVSAKQVGCDFRVVPSIDDITAGKVNVSQIRRVEIEDLLNREPYRIDLETLREFISGRKILVTGAGGSIGSEICRQVLKLKPACLTLFDISEYLLFEIERELAPIASGMGTVLRAVTGDVRAANAVREAIRLSGGIDIIYHAAAYKHVDLMERNPFACVENNVLGTANVASIAEECGVKQFVLISTDKAVRPTSLMGASKRLAERCLIERPERGTKFKAVRFGNVLGSSGSVVPIFKAQIAAGGPVTVTSRDVTRFFMTIPEAVELVLAAGAIGDDRRILVLEMGQPVKIDTLARQMIELSGFVPDVDIPVVYTGLKSGEKAYEELLTDDENVVRTDHDRIWVVEKTESEGGLEPLALDKLRETLNGGDETALREFVHSRIQGSLLQASSSHR